LHEAVTKAALKTFEDFCGLVPTMKLDERHVKASFSAAVSVAFRKPASGVFIMTLSGDLPEAIAAGLTGSQDFTPQTRDDAVSEVANIICGASGCHQLRPPVTALGISGGFNPFADVSVSIGFEGGRADIFLFLDRKPKN